MGWQPRKVFNMSISAETPPPWADIPATGPLLRPKDAAAYIGYSPQQYYALATIGEMPPLIKIGRGQKGASGVPRPWLDAVIASRHAEGGAA